MPGRSTNRLETNLSAKLVRGYARFTGPDRVEVNGETIVAKRFIIAAGSRPVVPEPWRALGDAMLTSDEIFELEELPESLGVIGLGAIGVEIGQAMARLGVRVVGVDQLETIAGLSDPRIAARAIEILGEELPLWLGEAASLERTAEGRVRIRTDSHETTVEKVLVAVGRRHNLDRLGLETLGVPLDERGVPTFDKHTQQVADLPIFIAGDASADRGVLHEATHQGRVAGVNAGAGTIRSFARKPTMWLAFTDPGIGQVGASWSELEGRDDVVVGEVDFANQGRAKVMRRHRGLLRVYGEKRNRQGARGEPGRARCRASGTPAKLGAGDRANGVRTARDALLPPGAGGRARERPDGSGGEGDGQPAGAAGSQPRQLAPAASREPGRLRGSRVSVRRLSWSWATWFRSPRRFRS